MDVASTLKEMTPLFLLPFEDILKNPEATNKLEAFIFDCDKSVSEIVYAAFASEHLPEYLDTTIETLKAGMPIADIFLSLLAFMVDTNSFARWVRENGEPGGKAMTFLGRFIIWLDEQFPVFSRRVSSPRQAKINGFARFSTGVIIDSILVQLSPLFENYTWTLLFESTEYEEASLRVSGHIASFFPPSPSTSSREDETSVLLALTRDFMTLKQTMRQYKTASLGAGTVVVPWLQCERRFGDAKCVEVEEMMACGKCKAVRYCSRAHQKADWKTHKKVCFEIKWAKDELDA